MGEYLGRTLRYPSGAREKGVSGKVTVGFTVATTGEILDLHIVKSVHEELDREALRVVRGMPRWIPGVQFNRPVKLHMLCRFFSAKPLTSVFVWNAAQNLSDNPYLQI